MVSTIAQSASHTDTDTCQICGRSIKANTGVIAHHGYKRPYQAGWQSASCPGARYVPYEVSCDRLREVIEDVARFLEKEELALQEFLAAPPTEIVTYEKRSSWSKEEKCVYTKPADFDPNGYRSCIPRTYELAYNNRKRDYEHTIRAAKFDLETMRKRLADWKPGN